MKNYHYSQVRNIHFGAGASNETGQIVAKEGIERVVVFTDAFLYEQGVLKGILQSLEQAGVTYQVFSDVRPNPLYSNVTAGYELMKSMDAQGAIGVGGGSSLDCCKASAMLMTNPLPLGQYAGVDKVKNDPPPIFTIPTTAGTGSEVTAGGVYVNDETGMKSGIISTRMMSTAAIVDPLLTLSVPPRLTAATGMDALTHAVETYTNVNANAQSEVWCREAIRLIGKYLRVACMQGGNVEARTGMARAAMYAGLAQGCGSGCAANHALAYPLENKYKIPHGNANASILAAVVKFNAPACQEKYAEVAQLLGENIGGLSLREAALRTGDAIQALCDDIGILPLHEYGVAEKDFQLFAEEACANERLMPPNPRKVEIKDAISIYRESY